MPIIEPFPRNRQPEAKTVRQDNLPEGVGILSTKEGLILVTEQTAILSASHRRQIPNEIKYAPDAFLSLLATMHPHEAMSLRITFDPVAAHPDVQFKITATGTDVDETVQRGTALALALNTALDVAFPDFTSKAPKAGKGFAAAHSVNLVPQGTRLPLSPPQEPIERPGARLVADSENALDSHDEIIFPPLPNSFEGLPTVTRLLAGTEGQIELVVTIRRQPLDAVMLRRLYTARSRLQDKSVAEFLEKAVLPFKDMGGNDYLTSILQDQESFEVDVTINSEQMLDETLATMLSFALFGAPLEKDTQPVKLDLRGLYPRESFQQKLLPILLALAPTAAIQEKPGHYLPKQCVLLGQTDEAIDVRLTERDRARHIYMIGSTGTGKSTLFANMIKQDIEEGKGVILFDPHGDLWQQVREAVPAERKKDLVLAHLGNTRQPFTMNILAGQGGDPAIERNTITNSLIDLFKRVLYQNIPEAFGPMFELYFRNALLLLMTAHGDKATIMDFERIFDETRYSFDDEGNNEQESIVDEEDSEPFNPFAELPDLIPGEVKKQSSRRKITFRRHLLKQCTDERVKAFWAMAENVDYNEITISNIAPYIVAKLTQITGSPLLAPVLGSRDSTLDFQQVIREGKICLINLAKGEVGAKDVAFAGGLMSIRLAMAAQAQARLPESERHQINVYMDEFQTYATDLLPDMMAEVRKYGLKMVLANQTLSQIDGRGFHADAAGGILGNVANLIAFRVGIPDADLLSRWFNPHFSAEDLAQLPDYTAAARLLANGQPLRPMTFQTLPPC